MQATAHSDAPVAILPAPAPESAIPEASVRAPIPGTRRATWWAPVASALVPGSGQTLLGQQRGVAYLAAEVYLVLQVLAAQRDGMRDRRTYRAIASDVARRGFGGTRPAGPWEYYELLERFDASGRFDAVPGGTLDPETDESTYNGDSWRLARETFFRNPDMIPAVSSPEYQRALAFYQERAVGDDFLWSWRDSRTVLDVYRQTIAASNRSYQRAVTVAGLVGVNHLASLIDAYITVRVRRYGGAGVAGLRLDGTETRLRLVGDPVFGRREWRSGIRLVPARP